MHIRSKPLLVALTALWTAGTLHAAGGWIWDPSATEAAPAWIESVQSESGSSVDTREFHVRPGQHPGKALAVTLFYQDGASGILRVIWSGMGGDVLLADSLLEGVDMLNRRTVMVTAEEATIGGRIVVHTDGGSGRLKRLAMDWVVPSAVYVSDEASAPYIRLRDQDIGRLEAEGAPPEPRDDQFHSRVTLAVLQDAPVGLAEDPAFQADLTVLPDRVLWECEVANLTPDSPLYLWINNRMAGAVSVAQPDLWDPGWFRDADGSYRYAGWRKARFWADPALLAAGGNLFQLDAPLGFGGGPSVRRVVLQAAYDRPVDPAPVPAAASFHPQPPIQP